MSLKRVLGPVDAAWLVAGNMIGSGIFITPGFVFGNLPGAWWALGAWLAGGLLALSGAMVYGELGARIPRAGGDYQYLRAGLGPLWGFLTGWGAFTLTFSAAAAAACNAAIGFVQAALPEVWRGAVWTTVGGPALVLLLTAANVLGARVSGRATVALTAVPLASLAVMAVWGLLAGDAKPVWPGGGVDASTARLPLAFGAAMLPVFFTYSGWNVAAYLAGEVREASRNLPRGLLLGTASVTLVYLAVNGLLLSVVPADTLAGSSTPGALAVERLLGPGASGAFSVSVALAILGSANVTLMAGARVYYAMAVDGFAPRALRRVNRAGVPHLALWAGGAWSAVLAATGTVARLVAWTTLAILLLSALTVVSLFVMRSRTGADSPYRCPGYPLTPLVYLVATLAVAVASTLYDPRSALSGILLLAAGVPIYVVVRERGRSGPDGSQTR